VVISTFIIVYCPTHIYRKGWLTIRLSLLIIFSTWYQSLWPSKLFSPFATLQPTLIFFFPMDSPPAATSPASHPSAAGREQLHVSDSSSHDSKLCRWNLRTQTISIGECRWSHISLVKVFFTLLTAPCRVLHLIWLMLRLVLPLPSALLFFVGSNKINFFWVLYSPLSPWMCCIL